MEIVILSILILLNGFFALSEIALVSSKRPRLEQARKSGSKGAAKALLLLDNSENFLSAIQVGITLIGIITGVYGGLNLADDVEPFLKQFDFFNPYADEIALILTVIIITFFSIVIGELVPKTVALSNPEKTAIRISPAIYYFSKVFFPVVKLLSISTSIINRMIGLRKSPEEITEAELRHMLKLATYDGVIEMRQNILHEKIFNFSDKKAKHIMTPRIDVEWIDINKSETEIRQDILNSRHSKLLVCKDEPDNFQGIIRLIDYYRSIQKDPSVQLGNLIQTPVIIPESYDAGKTLDLLKSNDAQICIVVNEYGGFEGIITIHDIAESIIGQIPNEGETYEPDIFVREDKSMLVNGDAPIETLMDIIDGYSIDFNEIDYSTVAGFVLFHTDKIPETGYKFGFMGYTIEIVDMDGNRIDKILISKTNTTEL